LRSILLDYCLPVILLCASVVTMTANGARFMHNFLRGLPPVVSENDLWPWPWLARHHDLFPTGFAFSLTLLAILLVHEFGHYIACRAHRIDATLPFVIPAPTLSGTLGAVIRIRSFIPNRNALMDVGFYGPVAGYVASAIAVVTGFLLSVPRRANSPGSIIQFGGEPLTIRAVHALLMRSHPRLPSFEHLALHPILLAGWIGLFITALNLLPGGQLDGGHILYALSPRAHKIITILLPLALFAAGVFCWLGWMVWGIVLLLPVMRHPKVPQHTELSPARTALGVLGVFLFLLTFTPTPFHHNSLLDFLR
jgi:membrane-associated protease RseP (regulator of RpoE activity)